jgi:hypothetical protein
VPGRVRCQRRGPRQDHRADERWRGRSEPLELDGRNIDARTEDARTEKVCDNIEATNIKLITLPVINGVFSSIAQNLANQRITHDRHAQRGLAWLPSC